MKQKLKKELVRRTRLILKTELNSKNRITAISTLSIPVITYSFNIIFWNLKFQPEIPGSLSLAEIQKLVLNSAAYILSL